MTQSRLRTLVSVGVATAMLALSGCASFGGGTPEQIVQKRAAEYWKARIEGKHEVAYGLSTPAYRQLHSAEKFRAQHGAFAAAKTAEVMKVTCEPEKCIAQVKLGVQPPIPGMKLPTVEMYVSETWLLEDGNWWHYQDL